MSEEVSESIKITGLRKTTKQLKALDAAAAKELRALERAAAERVAIGAREDAPDESGKLKGTIKVGVNAGGAYVKAGGKLVPYAGAIHWGWHRHHIKPNKFVYRSFDRERPVIEETFVRQIDSLVRRTVHGDGKD